MRSKIVWMDIMKPVPAALGAALILSVPSLAVAQDFLGGLARAAAQSAAQRLVERAVTAATTPRQPPATPSRAPAQTDHAGGALQSTTPQAPVTSALPADLPLPRPVNWTPTLRRPTEMRFSQADQDTRAAFDEIGRYSCTGCEGGRGFDSWPRHEVPGLGVGNYNLENRLGGLAVGEALRWTGSRTRTTYAITVVSDRAIGQWACKQLKWTGDRGETHAERLGLICRSGENWRTVL